MLIKAKEVTQSWMRSFNGQP